ncbi:MAG TPA: NAD(P)-binding domain-containing protein [Dehalococcoidia bacterium]|nr:NAD(P)-binding domain-containing protein [Dehalococcoidia bacterium]
MKKVGVIGCGQMGSGIAQVCAQAGYQVVVSEVNDEFLDKGLSSIDTYLARSVQKERITQQDKDAIIGRIKGTTSMNDFGDCDIVLEAAVEDMKLKKDIFHEIDGICPQHAILATNTSCLSVTEIAAVTKRPDKILGLHFFNPVPVMRLLELIKTASTSEETVKISKEFGESLDKSVVTVQDSPGFIVNRLMTPQILNAIKMLESGIATKEDIDTGMTQGLNYPMGPLALADLIGLDTLLYIANGIHEQLKESQYIAPPLLKKMVSEGQLGRKTGKGFYEYN